MKRALLIVICLAVLIPIFPIDAQAELGDWKMYVIWRADCSEEEMFNHGQANALVSQLMNKYSSEPGHANDVWVDWVQDGRQGEDPEDWLFWDGFDPWLPVAMMYMGGGLYTEDVALDDSEDTDYMLTMYWDASFGESGAYMVMAIITNRIYDPGFLSLFNNYCDMPFPNTPPPVCP